MKYVRKIRKNKDKLQVVQRPGAETDPDTYKFPEIDEEIIKQLSLSDPSDKNAYLMWMTKVMKDSGAGIYSVPGLARERIFDIVPIVNDFHKAKQRISQLNKNRKKQGKSLYPNDINQVLLVQF